MMVYTIMTFNLLFKGLPPLLERIELNKKTVKMIFPPFLKYLRPWGIIRLPTAYADYNLCLNDQPQTVGKPLWPSITNKSCSHC